MKRVKGGQDGDEDENEEEESSIVVRRYPSSLVDTSPQALAESVIEALEGGSSPNAEDGEEEADGETGIIFPEDVEEAVNDTIEEVKRRSGPIAAHIRLGRIIRRVETDQDGNEVITVKATRPSQKAIDEASKEGKILSRGGEFWRMGQVIEPDKVEAFLESFRAKLRAKNEDDSIYSLEDLEARYPDDFIIRHETWVQKGFRGSMDDKNAIKSIIAVVKKETEI
jgi:hypothetical protein